MPTPFRPALADVLVVAVLLVAAGVAAWRIRRFRDREEETRLRTIHTHTGSVEEHPDLPAAPRVPRPPGAEPPLRQAPVAAPGPVDHRDPRRRRLHPPHDPARRPDQPHGRHSLRGADSPPGYGTSDRLLGCRTSFPRTMNTTISATLVAWSANRSRCLAANMTEVARRMFLGSSIMTRTMSLKILR